MKVFFRKISVVLMTFLMLLSTFSFAVEKHICGGEVADISILGKARGCEMPLENESDNSCEFEKEPCCKDITHIVDSSNSELKTSSTSDFELKKNIDFNFYAYQYLLRKYSIDNVNYCEYSPPTIEKDFQLFYQTFLI